MKRVWKYQFMHGAKPEILAIPVGARFLKCGTQKEPGVVCFWMELNEGTLVHEHRTFRVFVTGETIPDFWEYRGTFQVPDGLAAGHEFVGHIYEDCSEAQKREDELFSLAAESERHHSDENY